DLALPERIVERIVDLADRDSEARGGIAIDDQAGLQALVLLVAADIGKGRIALERGDELRRPFVQLLEGRALQRILIRRIGRASAGAEIADRLQEQGGAGDGRKLAE